MRRLIPLLFVAACSGGAAKKPVPEKPEPEAPTGDLGAIVYVDSGGKGHQWIDLATAQTGTIELGVATVVGHAGDVAWLSGFEDTGAGVMVLAKVARAEQGVRYEVVDTRPAPVWHSKSILRRSLTGARAVAPDGSAELLVCPDDTSLVCVRSMTDHDADLVTVQYSFGNPSYGAWTSGGPLVFDAGDTGTDIVAFEPKTGKPFEGGHIDGWSVPAVSDDGTRQVWFDESGELVVRDVSDPDLRRIPLEGATTTGECAFTGAEQLVCVTGQKGFGNRLFAVDLGAGEARLLSDELGQPMFAVSPGGDQIAVSMMTATVEDGGVPRLAIVRWTDGDTYWVGAEGETIQYPVAWVARAE